MSEFIMKSTSNDWCEYVGVLIRCKDCKWFGKIGCAVLIVDESDKPKEDDYCSWAERREE